MAGAPQRRPSPLLLGLCVGVMLGTAFAVLRVRPATRALVSAQQRRTALEQSIAGAPVVVDPSGLEAEIEALRAERAALAARSAELAERVAPEDELPALDHQVAALARDAGLRLEQQSVTPGGRARRWTLSGSFAGLWRFIASLDSLPRRVVLRDLQVVRATEEQATGGAGARRRAPQPPLRIRVTVVP